MYTSTRKIGLAAVTATLAMAGLEVLTSTPAAAVLAYL
jgi:hypothetical protein